MWHNRYLGECLFCPSSQVGLEVIREEIKGKGGAQINIMVSVFFASGYLDHIDT